MYCLYCRIVQLIMKMGMYLLPWHTPKVKNFNHASKDVGKIISEDGFSRPLIVTGKGLKNKGLLDDLINGLLNEQVDYVIYEGIDANPKDIEVNEGVKLYRELQCDCLIAIGGGSCIDLAKGIGASHVTNKSIRQLHGLFKVLGKMPSLYSIPTTAGTGSETTMAAVITDSSTKHKASIIDISLMSKYVFLDPLLTINLPDHITRNSGLDALTHAVECYINGTYNTAYEDELCLEAIKLIKNNLLEAYMHPHNIDARNNMLLASFKAGRAFTRGCVGYVHAIGHPLTSLYNIPHGEVMGILLPKVLRLYKNNERLLDLAYCIGFINEHEFIRWIEEISKTMSLKSNIQIKANDIDQISKWAIKEANPLYPCPIVLKQKDIINFLNNLDVM